MLIMHWLSSIIGSYTVNKAGFDWLWSPFELLLSKTEDETQSKP